MLMAASTCSIAQAGTAASNDALQATIALFAGLFAFSMLVIIISIGLNVVYDIRKK